MTGPVRGLGLPESKIMTVFWDAGVTLAAVFVAHRRPGQTCRPHTVVSADVIEMRALLGTPAQ